MVREYTVVMVVAAMNLMKGEHLMSERKTDESVLAQSIKVRIKRIARHNEHFIKNRLDEKHVNANLVEFPRHGEQFQFSFIRMDEGYWRTTPVKYISFQDGKILFGTKNSVYEIIDGWKED